MNEDTPLAVEDQRADDRPAPIGSRLRVENLEVDHEELWLRR